MKNSTFYCKGKFMHSKILMCIFFVLLFLTNKTNLSSTNAIFYADNPDLVFFSPDTIPPDTTAIFTEGDTLETYLDGASIVHILYEDTSAAQDSMEMLLWEFTDNQPHILVEFSDNAGAIQQGLFGFNIGNIFLPGHAYEPEFEIAYGEDPTPFDLLSVLRPNVLRFPAGQSATFMQPLGSPFTSDEGNVNYGNLNGGYGYDIESMIGYYDMSDGIINAFTPPIMDMVDLLAQIEDDMYDPIDNCDDCVNWIDGDQIKDFEDKYRLWHDQVNFDPTGLEIKEMDELYINDFINLVKKIEDENIGHIVDVIYCADILSQTAEDVLDVITYLRSNDIHNVNVVGVELGNEVYAEFFAKTVGFTTTAPEDFEEFYEANDFEHYWNYINGDNYTGLDGWSNTELEDAMPDDVETDHDFILKLKDNEATYDIKIGLPARPHRSCDEFIFIYEDRRDEVLPDPFTEPCPYPQWNIDMTAYYAEELFSGPADSYLYSFDAVNIHNYITPRSSTFLNSHYRDIILPPDDNCLDGDYTFDTDLERYDDGAWDFADMDERLECAYYGLIGLGNLPGNFHQAIKSDIEDSQADHANYLKFLATDDGPEVKEQWSTEYAVSANEKDPEAAPFIGVVANSYLQAYVTQEWMMKNIKMNFIAAARDNFFTIATMQNFLGGVATDLMTPTDMQDQLELGMILTCSSAVANHYAPRITYHAMSLMKEIFNGNYQYLKTTTTMYSGNPNLPPTVFIYPSGNKVIFVYTNTRNTTQTYYIDPDEVGGFYDDLNVSLNDHEILIYSVDADQLYSTSGRSTFYDINTFYDACTTGYVNRFEITSTSFESNTGTCSGAWGVEDGVCVKVPANSCGYFIIEMEPYLKIGENTDIFSIYPNPASTFFTLLYSDQKFNTGEDVTIDIYSISGAYQKTNVIKEGANVDISDLPVGVYLLNISQNGIEQENEILVKMK